MLTEPKSRLEILKEYLQPLGVLYCHPLFEGYSLSIKRKVFGMRVHNEFYLRACPGSQEYIEKNNPAPLEINRKGRKITLNYYHIDQHLWNDPEKLLCLSSASLDAVNEEKKQQCQNKQLNDLANITFSLKNLLIQAGINDVSTFFSFGSKGSWLKLQGINKHISLNTLYALEGAVQGLHASVLPSETRSELQSWFHEFLTKRGKQVN